MKGNRTEALFFLINTFLRGAAYLDATELFEVFTLLGILMQGKVDESTLYQL